MRELSVREMRAGYRTITEALESDGEVVLTHHGKPFARILPIVRNAADANAISPERMKQLQVWGRQRRKALSTMEELPPFDWASSRKDRV